MSSYFGSRRRKTSISVIIPYLLVYLVGLSTGYAIWYRSGPPSEPAPGATMPTVATPAPPSVEVTKSHETPAAAEPTEAAASAPAAAVEPAETAPEDATEVWPGRSLFIAVKGEQLSDDAKALLKEVRPGGVVLIADNIKNRAQTIQLINDIKEAAGLGKGIADLPLIAVDQEGGTVNRLKLKDAPGAAQLGANEDAAAAQKTGRDYAAACTARGIGVLLAPVLDIYEPGVSPAALESRAFGTTGDAVARQGLAFATGVMEGGVVPVVKHFPGHGASAQDTHTALAVIDRDVVPLAQVMYPFLELTSRGVPGVMAGHIAAPMLEQGQKRPASLSPVLVGKILRGMWNYEGVVITDDLAMGAITSLMPVERAAVEALTAGCDAVMMLDPDPGRVRSLCAAIRDAAASGQLPRQRLAESAKRLDRWQEWLRQPQGLLQSSLPVTTLAKAAEQAPAAPTAPEAQPSTSATTEVPPGPMAPPPAQQPAPSVTESAPAPKPDEPTEAPTLKTHEVRKGESLSKIAAAYKVTANDLIAWNHLAGDNIQVGQKLIVENPNPAPEPSPAPPVPAETEDAVTPPAEEPSVPAAPNVEPTVAPVPAPDPMPKEEKPVPPNVKAEEPAPKETQVESVVPETVAPQPPHTEKVIHEIKPGEMLSRIAAKYGVKQKDIIAWNSLEGADIKWGRKLVVYVPANAPPVEEPKPAEPPPADQALAEDAAPSSSSEPAVPPSESAPFAPPPNTTKREHAVSAGETLEAVAEEYGVSVDALRTWNSLTDAAIQEGQKLQVYLEAAVEPAPAKTEKETTAYVVASGDTISKIAAKHRITRQELLDLNSMDNPHLLRPGQRIKVPKR